MTLEEALANPPIKARPTNKQPKILIWDIENSPATGEFWGSTYNTNIIRVTKPSSVICFAAKWLGEKETMYFSDYHDGHHYMVEQAWELLNEADGVVSYNGKNHDTPHINTEFKLQDWGPPSPYKQIDLYKVVKFNFKFQQNKLSFVADQLGIGSKLAHEGYDLWVRCGENDPKAWDTMRRYNIQDVKLTEWLFADSLAWIPQHMLPHPKLYGAEGNCCGRCGSQDIRKDDKPTTTPLGLFEMFQCNNCGSWLRGRQMKLKIDLRGI